MEERKALDKIKELEDKYKVFEKPKKTISIFTRFIKKNKNNIKKKFKVTDFNDIRKYASEMWKTLNIDEKTEYKSEYNNDFKLYSYRKKEFKNKGYFFNNKTIEDYESQRIGKNSKNFRKKVRKLCNNKGRKQCRRKINIYLKEKKNLKEDDDKDAKECIGINPFLKIKNGDFTIIKPESKKLYNVDIKFDFDESNDEIIIHQ